MKHTGSSAGRREASVPDSEMTASPTETSIAPRIVPTAALRWQTSSVPPRRAERRSARNCRESSRPPCRSSAPPGPSVRRRLFDRAEQCGHRLAAEDRDAHRASGDGGIETGDVAFELGAGPACAHQLEHALNVTRATDFRSANASLRSSAPAQMHRHEDEHEEHGRQQRRRTPGSHGSFGSWKDAPGSDCPRTDRMKNPYSKARCCQTMAPNLHVGGRRLLEHGFHDCKQQAYSLATTPPGWILAMHGAEAA